MCKGKTLYLEYQQLIEQALEKALPIKSAQWMQNNIPAPLNEAMRYSLLAGGKRLRPIMLMAAYSLAKEQLEECLPFAVALEMIHTYSLVHDDLPAMDDDELRRGIPTNHMVFGEGIAILTGDALLNEAYEICAHSNHPQTLPFLRILSNCAGARGMIAGQTADLIHEGEAPSMDLVRYLQYNKTVRLFYAAIVGGLTLASAKVSLVEAGKLYATAYGTAFQIIDDLSDIFSDAETMGKNTQKDKNRQKPTWPAAFGVEQSFVDAKTYCDEAINIAEQFGERGILLAYLAQQLLVSIPKQGGVYYV